MKKLRTVFFGTPDFAVATLEMLAHHPAVELVAVVSMPDRPAGRGQELKSPEVIQYARAAKLPTVQTVNINKESDLLASWEEAGVDLMIVLAFAQFLGERLLKLPSRGCFNIHTSLLPRYRGAAPIQYALWNGDQETGVTIQKMVKKMDAGDVVHARPIAVASSETGGQLTTRLKFQAALSCNDFLEDLLANKLIARPQDETRVSFAPTLKKSDGHLDFARQTVKQITCRLHAMDPWPGAYCFLGNKRLKILKTEPFPASAKPGEVKNQMNALIVGCLDGSLRLSVVQLEGKKPGSDTELLNGWRGELSLSAPPKEDV